MRVESSDHRQGCSLDGFARCTDNGRVATVRFTDNIQRHVACPPALCAGATVRESLDAYFASNERARGYVLDEHGSLRKHMAIFVDGKQVADREHLSDTVTDATTIDVMQALSGG